MQEEIILIFPAVDLSLIFLSLRKPPKDEEIIFQNTCTAQQELPAELQQEKTRPRPGDKVSKSHYRMETMGNKERSEVENVLTKKSFRRSMKILIGS